MHEENFPVMTERAIRLIREGAFLTVQAGDILNVMTIGWATIGYIWARPVLCVLIRKSRYTFDIIERAGEFTVSVPLVDMRGELEICGTQSGRNIDKIKKCRLELFPGEKVKTPVLNIPGIHFECAIVYKSPMAPVNLNDVLMSFYPANDYHTIYYGEIRHCYSAESDR